MEMIAPATDEMHAVAVTGAAGRLHGWEFKNKHMHRGVLNYLGTPNQSVDDVERVVRLGVLNMYRPSWNRGFAFGAVVQFETTPVCKLAAFVSVVNAFNNSKGVWQWVIAVDQQAKNAHARHMWMEGAIHDHFKKTVAQLCADGYSVTSTYAEQPSFFSSLNSLTGALLRARTLISLVGAVMGFLTVVALALTDLMR